MILLIIVLGGIARNLKRFSHINIYDKNKREVDCQKTAGVLQWLKRDISIPGRRWEMSIQN